MARPTHRDLPEKSSAEHYRYLLRQGFAAIHQDARELLMRGHNPTVKSKAMSTRLAQLEASWTGTPAPESVQLVTLTDLMKRAARRMR